MANKKINWLQELNTARGVFFYGMGKFFQYLINVLVTLILIFVLTGIIVVSAFTVYINNYVETEVDVSLFRMNISSTTTHIYRYEFIDRANRVGEVVPMDSESDYHLQGAADQTFVSYDKIPENMINAVIAIEDKRFITHNGVDWRRTVAAGANFFIGFDDVGYGGSSITQQLIKNITGEDDYSIQRKIQEIFWALDLETKMDKEEILELYLNIVNFGNGSNGVQAAAYNYFSKDVSELTLIECAAIAGITQNPSKYNPIYYPENNAKRRNTVLAEMYSQGLITQREYEEAYQKELVLNVPGRDEEQSAASDTGINSWYVDMVIEDVIDDLVEQKGYSSSMASLLIYNGGLDIYTLVDPEIQEIVETIYKEETVFPVDKSGIKAQCSCIIIDPVTGDVLGVAGARGEKTANRLQNFATQTTRAPGSSIKPLAVYAPSVERGLITWSSVYDDTPFMYIGTSSWPKNATNVYRGLTNINYAITQSTNTIAVKVLDRLGLQTAFDFCYDTLEMKSMIERGTRSDGSVYTDVGYSALALGQLNYGVTVREITAAYTIFANSGIYSRPNSYLKVTDSEGNIVLENKYSGTVAISEDTASLMTLMMENVVESGTAKALTFDDTTGIDVAGKTGSAGEYYDRWFIGYTPYYICGVWYGYEYPKTINTSSNPCVTVWDEVMTQVHNELVLDKVNSGEEKLKTFNITNNIIQCTYCKDSGLLAGEACSLDPRGNRLETGYFISGTEPTETCGTHIAVDYDMVEKALACKYCPPENITRISLVKVDRGFERSVAITDAQYSYIELPFDVMPYTAKTRPYYYNLCSADYYLGYSGIINHYNCTCIAHFDAQAWREEVDAIIAAGGGEETAVALPDNAARRRMMDFFGLGKKLGS